MACAVSCGGSSSGGGGTTATAQQYASIVAGDQADIAKTAHALSKCPWMAFGAIQKFTCQTAAKVAKLEAETLTEELRSAGRVGDPDYIGKPPSEIARLVSSTLSAAANVVAESKKAEQISKWRPRAFLALGFTENELVKSLAGWRPYGA
jgi:hypothetical protein